MGKRKLPHKCCRTRAKTSLKVAVCFWYQAACLTGKGPLERVHVQRAPPGCRGPGAVASSAPSPGPPIVVASPDLQCARPSSKVVSKLQRLMKSPTISCAGWVGSVENKALAGRFPAGSRVRTQAREPTQSDTSRRFPYTAPAPVSPYQSKVRR